MTTSKQVKYKAHDGKLSAWEAMPTRQAELRAARFPVAGDRWTEMFSVWYHVDEVTATEVAVRVYVGPCSVTPSEARETRVFSRVDFESWILQCASYESNARWAAFAGGVYEAKILDTESKIEHWKTTRKP